MKNWLIAIGEFVNRKSKTTKSIDLVFHPIFPTMRKTFFRHRVTNSSVVRLMVQKGKNHENV
ncbi:hypothetical protein B0E43_09110 [Algoriphagus sp. A40]|nr:hypothetical protein B0E43_09110 [Algoriphagus sp. A40]